MNHEKLRTCTNRRQLRPFGGVGRDQVLQWCSGLAEELEGETSAVGMTVILLMDGPGYIQLCSDSHAPTLT